MAAQRKALLHDLVTEMQVQSREAIFPVFRPPAACVRPLSQLVDRAVVPSLAMILTRCGEAGERLLADGIDSAKPRLSPHHLAAIREFQYAYGCGGNALGRRDEPA